MHCAIVPSIDPGSFAPEPTGSKWASSTRRRSLHADGGGRIRPMLSAVEKSANLATPGAITHPVRGAVEGCRIDLGDRFERQGEVCQQHAHDALVRACLRCERVCSIDCTPVAGCGSVQKGATIAVLLCTCLPPNFQSQDPRVGRARDFYREATTASIGESWAVRCSAGLNLR